MASYYTGLYMKKSRLEKKTSLVFVRFSKFSYLCNVIYNQNLSLLEEKPYGQARHIPISNK